MQRNTPDEQLAAWPRAWRSSQAIRAAVGKVRKGDVIDLDLDPARGTLFSPQWHTAGTAIAG
jgi:hypothetical protein